MSVSSQMHIVSLKKGLNPTEAKANSEGISVLGFFIDVSCSNILTPHGVRVAKKSCTSPLSSLEERLESAFYSY